MKNNLDNMHYVDEQYHLSQGGVIRYGQNGKYYQPSRINHDDISTGYIVMIVVVMTTIIRIVAGLILL